MVKKILGTMLSIPAAMLAVVVDLKFWYISLIGAIALWAIACWMLGGVNE